MLEQEIDFINKDERVAPPRPVRRNAVEDIIKHDQHTDGLKLLAEVEDVVTNQAAVYVHVCGFGKGVQAAVCEKLDGKSDFFRFRLILTHKFLAEVLQGRRVARIAVADIFLIDIGGKAVDQ